ncbi:hypothetical protein ACFFJN_04405 [Erwinia mallotivora]|uniref:hypothetical protein n=1 Tax=Erwinia mallotivora TaxID=69222 RepID=UPI0035EB4722
MVKFIKLMPAFLFFISVGTESRGVSHVEIYKTGIPYEGRRTEALIRDCAVFKPTKEQIIHFFNVAKKYEESVGLLHDFYSPCISTGSVTFKDGLSGTWVLQSSGLASFFIDGEKKATFFTRNNKWDDPFGCVYGADDASSC